MIEHLRHLYITTDNTQCDHYTNGLYIYYAENANANHADEQTNYYKQLFP